MFSSSTADKSLLKSCPGLWEERRDREKCRDKRHITLEWVKETQWSNIWNKTKKKKSIKGEVKSSIALLARQLVLHGESLSVNGALGPLEKKYSTKTSNCPFKSVLGDFSSKGNQRNEADVNAPIFSSYVH